MAARSGSTTDRTPPAGADKEAVKAAIAADPRGFYGRAVPGAKLKGDGQGRLKMPCPFHTDGDPSLTIYPDGGWHCFGCGEHGDGLDFIGRLRGLDFPEALQEAAGILGLSAAPAQRKPEPTRYQVRDADGNLLATHCRLDLPGGKKVWWEPRGIKPPTLPLYNLSALLAASPSEPVFVVEGEKCADALTRVGKCAVGTYGTGALPCDASLQPLLERIVILWPDADEPGRAHMHEIGERLRALGGEPLLQGWADAPEKGDAADFLATNDAAALDALMEQEVTPFGSVETATPAAKSDFERLWTAAELLRTDFPDVKYIAPGLLPEGLALLGGRAKLGKSWLALQLACAVGSGGRMFGLQVEQRQVLYLALEDGPRRIKKRMKLQQWPGLENVAFGYEAAPDRLGRMVDETGCQLLIIDTFSRFFNLDQQDVQPVTNALGKLQRFAGERDITILVIDHHNKAGTGDPIQDLLGSTGKGASADTVWGLYRDRGQRDACLKVVGRDMEDADLRLAWDPELHCWQLVADDAPGKHDAAIFAALKEGPAGVSELARRMKVSKGVLPETLARLVNRGLLNVDPATKRYSRNE